MNEIYGEIMTGVRSNSEILILDFNQIPKETKDYANISKFFTDSLSKGLRPRSPEMRQRFNDNFLDSIQKKYLVGRYLEDRKQMLLGTSIEKEGRTIHLGIDIFSKDLDPVFSPEDGEIVRASKELGDASYGNYVIVKHISDGKTWYSFYGHLSHKLPELKRIKKAEIVGWLGDYANGENGGWSRHLHFQILNELPKEGETPIGYSTKENVSENSRLFPDPNKVLNLPILDI